MQFVAVTVIDYKSIMVDILKIFFFFLFTKMSFVWVLFFSSTVSAQSCCRFVCFSHFLFCWEKVAFMTNYIFSSPKWFYRACNKRVKQSNKTVLILYFLFTEQNSFRLFKIILWLFFPPKFVFGLLLQGNEFSFSVEFFSLTSFL